MIGWRAHLGAIFPTPVPGRVVREFYEVVPDGVDLTMASLTIRQLTVEDLEEAMTGVERAAEQLARFEVDMIYLLGVPPIVLRGAGYDQELITRMERAAGRPACTDITGVMEAFRTLSLRRLVMATPFEDDMNERIKKFLGAAGFEIVHMKGLGIRRNVDIRKLAIPIEYTFTREVVRESPVEPDGIYIPCGGWGTVHNIRRLEEDLGKPVVTWFQAMIWWTLRQAGVRAPVSGYGKLLESLRA
jgi:maleate isomerase